MLTLHHIELKWWSPGGYGQDTACLCYISSTPNISERNIDFSLVLTTYNYTMLKCWHFFFYGISRLWSSCLQLWSKVFLFIFLLAICNLLYTFGCQLALFPFIIPNTAVKSFLSWLHTSAKHTGQFLLDNMFSSPTFYYFLPFILSTWFFFMAST